MAFTKEQLDEFFLGIDNIKKLIENKDIKPPQGWLVYIISDINSEELIKYLTKNGFKKDSRFKRINNKWRYFDLDEDKFISQLSPADFIEAQNYVNLDENNLIFASDLLGLKSKLTLQERSTLISILPDQDISNIISKLK